MEKKTKTKTKSKTKEVEDIHFEDDRKIISRAKYMRNARRVLTGKKDYEVTVTKKDDIRKRKMPTARKLKREELRKSFSPVKRLSRSERKTFQPRGRNH